MCAIPPSITEVASRIFIGNVSSSMKRDVLQDNHITAIVSLLHEAWGRWGILIPQSQHLYIPCLDNDTMDILVFMSDACDFIDSQLAASASGTLSLDNQTDLSALLLRSRLIYQDPSRAGNILAHCQQGISRSAAVVIAYLMRKNHTGLEETLAGVREKRKVKRSKNFMEQLGVWEAVGYEIWEDKEKKMPKPQYQLFLDKRSIRLKA